METNLQRLQVKQLLIYLGILILMYPIVAHMLMYEFGIFKDKLPHGPFWLFVQIFLSGPFLLIIGLILFFKISSALNRVIGILLIIISVYWLYKIIYEIMTES